MRERILPQFRMCGLAGLLERAHNVASLDVDVKKRTFFSVLPRCTALSREVRIRDGRTKSTRLAHCAGRQCGGRKASRSCAQIGHSPCRRDGSHWPRRQVTCEAGWSA